MRVTLACAVWLGTVFAAAGLACGDIAYHFSPGVSGQVRGFSQFAAVAPETGDPGFTVLLSGSQVGFAPSSDPSSARAYLDKWGLGVLNPTMGKDAGVQGQVQLDGKHGGEYLRLEFPVAVRLTRLTFASVGLSDDFDLLADGVSINLDALFPGAKTISDISRAQGNWVGTIDFTKAAGPLSFAKRWDVVVPSPVFGDGIQLENALVERVPEPSAMFLASSGLFAWGIWTVQRRVRHRSGGRRGGGHAISAV
jgi:hypothetical protein